MAEEVLTTQRLNDVLILTLNRPEALNALNPALMLAIEAFGRSMLSDPARVLVIRGAGRHFCAGADLKAPASDASLVQRRRDAQLGGRMLRAIIVSPK
jgi:enoyl-CoA hydratase/carnithine racemase